MSELVYYLANTGSTQLIQPPFEVRSIEIDNNSSETVTVTDESGNVYQAAPHTIWSVPCRPSGAFHAKAARQAQGTIQVIVRDYVKTGTFGVPGDNPQLTSVTTVAGKTVSLVLTKPTSLITVYVSNPPSPADTLQVYLTIGSQSIVLLNSSFVVGGSVGELPFVFGINAPEGASLTFFSASVMTLMVGY